MIPVKVFCTTGSEEIAIPVCEGLKGRIPEASLDGLGKKDVVKFSNENIQVQVGDVRGSFVIVIHTQVSPVNENLMELFALLDSIANAGPKDVLLVFPYMPYARSDRKNNPRISTMGQFLPRVISEILGVRKVLLMDPHDGHVKHYFHPTAEEITSIFIFVKSVGKEIFSEHKKENCVIVFADEGAAKRFKMFSKVLKLPSVYIDKGRDDNSESPSIHAVVGDVKDKICILVDDEILSGNTAVEDAKSLKHYGAERTFLLVVHPILMDAKRTQSELMNFLNESPIDRIFTTNSVPIGGKELVLQKLKILPVSELLAEAIARIIMARSVSELHDPGSVRFYT